MRDAICQARAHSREFGWGPCFNYAKAERFGLHVCGVHKNFADRLAVAHGDEYALMIVRSEWGHREAQFPRVRPEVWTEDA